MEIIMLCQDQILCISSGNLEYIRKCGEKPCINKIPTFKELRKAVFLKLNETAILHDLVNFDTEKHVKNIKSSN